MSVLPVTFDDLFINEAAVDNTDNVDTTWVNAFVYIVGVDLMWQSRQHACMTNATRRVVQIPYLIIVPNFASPTVPYGCLSHVSFDIAAGLSFLLDPDYLKVP